MNNLASVENIVIDLHNSWFFITSVRKPNLIIVKFYIKQKNNSAGLNKRGAAFRYLDTPKPPLRSQRIFFVLFINYCQNICETFTCIFRKRKNNSMTREMSRATNSTRVVLSGRSYREDFICSMSPGPTPLSVTVIEYSEMAPACLSPIRCFARKAFTWSIDQSDWTTEQAPNLTLRLSLNRAFSHDVTAAILVFQNNETAAMLGVLNKPCGSWTLS